jgi:hypothetical protein
VILWFAGVSFVFVWWVFRSPALDYRLVMLGSVLPVGEAVFGGPRLLHTLIGPVALLVVLMLATQRRRLVRRRWIGLLIGMLMHLALDGIWARADVFWWPFFGPDFGTEGLPELGHPLGITVLMELAGLACLAWAWRMFGFSDPATRDRFVRTGHLDRTVGHPPTC